MTASTLTSCTALETDANGNVLCGSDATGSGVGIGDTVTSGTTGSILFVGSGPVLAQDNANLFWDDTNNRLGIGTTSPWAKLSVNNYSSGASSVPLFTVASSTGTGATSTAFIINSVGNIGIGTTSPNALLHLFSTVASNNNPQLILQNYAAGGYLPSILFQGNEAGSPNTYSVSRIVGGFEGGANWSDAALGFDVGQTLSRVITLKGTGNVGIASTTPFSTLSVNGNVWLNSNILNIASSSASTLTVNYLSRATTTIPSNQIYAWSIATSTTASPLLTFNTNGPYATTSINGGFVIDSGAVNYDSSSGIISADSIQTGPMGFDTDAGIVSWIDMPVATTSTSRISMSYSAQIDSIPILTVYGESTAGGGVSTTTVGIGTTTPTWLLHLASTTPYLALSDTDAGLDQKHWLISNQSGSLRFGTSSDANPFSTSTNFMLQRGGNAAVPKGAFCVDDDNSECPVGAIQGRLYSINATVLTDDIAEFMRSAESLEPGDIVIPDSDFKNKTARSYEQERRSRDLGTTLGLDEIGVKKSVKPYESAILGVISTKPGISLGGFEPTLQDYEVTLAGRVPVKVSLEGGAIKIGDRITSSPIPGVGMKATSSGITIGIALEDFNPSTGSGQASSTEKILVFVNLGYSKLDASIQGGEIVEPSAVALRAKLDGEGESAFWGIDQTSGRIKFISPLDLNDFDIVNVRAILGSGGKWSIDFSGRLTAEEVYTKKLCLEEVCVTKEELKKLLDLAGSASQASSPEEQTSDEGLPEEGPPEEPQPSSTAPGKTSDVLTSSTSDVEEGAVSPGEESPPPEPPPEPEPPPVSDTSTTTPAT